MILDILFNFTVAQQIAPPDRYYAGAS